MHFAARYREEHVAVREPARPTRESSYVGPLFDDVFRAELAPLRGYLYRRVGSPAAEDLAAETFAIAFRSWGKLDPERPVRPWLYGIATNLLRHHRRKELRMLRAYARTGVDPITSQDESSDDRLDALAQRSPLAAAVADLRSDEREVLLLHAWAGLSDNEIAAALSVPVGTVKSRLHRGREHLRNHLAGIGQIEADPPTMVKEST